MDDNQQCTACCSCCSHQKHTPRSEEQLKSLNSRLNRIIGQLGGIKNMLEDNRYCGDILIQLSAVQSALESFGYEILGEHLRTCVVENVQSGNTQILDEALALIKKLKQLLRFAPLDCHVATLVAPRNEKMEDPIFSLSFRGNAVTVGIQRSEMRNIPQLARVRISLADRQISLSQSENITAPWVQYHFLLKTKNKKTYRVSSFQKGAWCSIRRKR